MIRAIRKWLGDFFFGRPRLSPDGMEMLEQVLDRRIDMVEMRQRRIRAEAEAWLRRG